MARAWVDCSYIVLRGYGDVEPGCYSQGETLDELMDNIREAIAGVLEVLREQGGQPETNVRILDVAV
ncbi:MAG: type II toxin-antitoxin system HicB family antitoxin [Bryobacteraceae bacterium]